MGTRKKGSELVFNLQWRNKPDNGGDKSNVIGMYDTPVTTLNFDTFKSYLLKNSGVAGNDVKVTFLTDTGSEWIIDCEAGFQIALAAFRLKARLGEVILLKLDKTWGPNRKHSADVQTQFDNDSILSTVNVPPEWFIHYMKQFKRDVVDEVTYAVTSNIVASKDKGEPKEEANLRKPRSESVKRPRKLGELSSDKEIIKTLKYDRKLDNKLDKLEAKSKKIKEKKQALISKSIELELLNGEKPKTREISRNLDRKGPLWSGGLAPHCAENVIHMIGGETYLHIWEIVNNGRAMWTKSTELRLTWGSAEMKPSVNVVPCPPLLPGERGTTCVRFEIPKKPGQYESYWNFYDGEVRFGQGLSCRVVVDEPITSLNSVPKKAKVDESQTENKFSLFSPLFPNRPYQLSGLQKTVVFEEKSSPDASGLTESSAIDLSTKMQNLQIKGQNQVDLDADIEALIWSSSRVDDTVDSLTLDCSSNKYGISEADLIVDLSNISFEAQKSSKVEELASEKVETDLKESNLVQDDNNNNGASANNNSSVNSICDGSEASDLSSSYDIVNALTCEEQEDSGYVHITFDGKEVAVPKNILSPKFLMKVESNAKEAREQEEKIRGDEENLEATQQEPMKEVNLAAAKLEAEISELEQNTKSFMSHCSTAGTCFSDANCDNSTNPRLFIFPQNNPGYEVVYPKLEGEEKTENAVYCPTNKVEVMPTDPLQTYTWAQSQSHYTLADIQNVRYDPYGPLEQQQSHTSSSQSSSTAQASSFQHIPNYQQSGPKLQEQPQPKPSAPTQPAQQHQPPHQCTSPTNSTVHILPENLVSGAVNVASSAINTARSVINMIVPPRSEPGKWVNGHWVIENKESPRARNLRRLAEMGFWDTDLNATLLARYSDDITRVVSELIQ